MDKYFIRWENNVVYLVERLQEGGQIYSSGTYLIETLANAKAMLSVIGVDCAKIDDVISLSKTE